MIRKLAVIALLILSSPLLIPLAALFLVIATCVSVYGWLWLRYFCWTHSDRVYLICSRRRGWEPLLRNNVVPVLPNHVSSVWLETPGALRDVVHAGRLSGVLLPKPFLIRVTRFRLLSVPLNSKLVGLKSLGAVSNSVRQDAQKIVETALADLDPCSVGVVT